MNYNIDSRKIVSNLLPAFLRTDKFLELLYSLTNGLEYCNANVLELLKYTNQTIYVEKWLNDKYDNISRRIYILVNDRILNIMFNKIEDETPEFYLYNRSESAANTYFKNRGEDYTISGYDYYVMIPGSLMYKFDEIKTGTQQFNPTDKNFTIKEIES